MKIVISNCIDGMLPDHVRFQALNVVPVMTCLRQRCDQGVPPTEIL